MRATLLGLSALVLTACGSDDHPPVSAGGSSSSSSSGGTTDSGAGGGGGEAGLPRENDALCRDLPTPPRVVDELAEPGDPPAARGGVLTPGTYELDGLNVYGSPDAAAGDGGETSAETPSGQSGSGTLVVTTSTLAFDDSYGPTSAPRVVAARGYAYSTAGTTISAAQVCPTTKETEAMPYTVSGSTIILFPDAHRTVAYRLKP